MSGVDVLKCTMNIKNVGMQLMHFHISSIYSNYLLYRLKVKVHELSIAEIVEENIVCYPYNMLLWMPFFKRFILLAAGINIEISKNCSYYLCRQVSLRKFP